MRRSLLVVLAMLMASAALVGFSSMVTRRLCAQHLVNPADDLAWLRREFRLGDAEMQRVCQLHEGYLPKCRELCERMAARKKQLQAALQAGPGFTPMLRHFYEVSQAMPREQGLRYLAEMQRLTLGFHEQVEQAMAGEAPAPHGHH